MQENSYNLNRKVYSSILNEILKKSCNNEIFFIDIYNFLDRINMKKIMPYILRDLKEIGITIIFGRTSTELKDFTVLR